MKIIEQGAAGRDSTGSEELGTLPGEPGADITLSVDYPITGIADTAVTLGSTGGRGGNGAYRVIRPNKPGSAGGGGGAVTLTLSGTVSGGSDHTTATPLIHLYSVGGLGGYGRPTNNSPNRGGFGAGGAGGPVTMDLTSFVNATGTSSPGIHLQSEGGQAGGLPEDADRGTTLAGMRSDAGGSGGTITLNIAEGAGVTTTGKDSPAVVASSSGGRGGSSTVSAVKYYGSNGGEGGAVTVANGGLIQTAGEAASALVLQSVGGRGGDGGGGSISASTAPGAAGGNGGAVTAQNASSGQIRTAGDFGFGLLAQSVGGAGGKGGDGSWWSGGGDGGAAGAGGTVDIFNAGSIITTGAHGTAIMAQSVGGGHALNAFRSSELMAGGGGGGSGGSAGWLSSGGSGGAGGNGGAVSFTNTGTVWTSGEAAYGVLAQSVGGGGGAGGDASTSSLLVAIALGGGGGSGGAGGDVTYDGQGGTVRTDGDESIGVLVQSIGGGGGSGGQASANAASPILSVAVAVGGSGGKGGNGGKVSVESADTIRTTGATAAGLQALSVGGGGGNGGGSNALTVAVAMGISGVPIPGITYSHSVGGSGGSGGTGGIVSVDHSGLISTYGAGGIGLQAQSIGGGGGSGGDALSYSLSIGLSNSPSISVSTALGGAGGSGGAGSTVNVSNSGAISTRGASASGLQAQSIGGGGGTAGTGDATADSVSTSLSLEVGVSVGGTGGNGGDGNTVTVENSGTITTYGDTSSGILAQSIGGGGGDSGSVSASAASGLSFNAILNGITKFLPLGASAAVAVAVGGSGGDGGNGGDVTVSAIDGSLIATSGAGATGILAQSVGGGGGLAGDMGVSASEAVSINVSLGGSGGAGGTGGTIIAENAGTIATSGDAGHGLFAQSIGGGGGQGGGVSSDNPNQLDTVPKVWAALREAVGSELLDAWLTSTGNTETKAALDTFIADVQDTVNYPKLAAAFKASDFVAQVLSFEDRLNDYIFMIGKETTSYANLTFSSGGNGGSGGTGGSVSASNSGSIFTSGDIAHGVFAQSVGGGGGQGGVAQTAGSSFVTIAGAMGGKGGSGNTGGSVTIANTGSVATSGNASWGLAGQSVGGGGGIGVGAINASTRTVKISKTVGGNGGQGGDGGAVNLTNAGSITTSGLESHAIVAQSVGGGGGTFFMNPQSETTSAAETDETVSQATIVALLMASGMAHIPVVLLDPEDTTIALVNILLGGSSGNAGNGGTLTLNHHGTIATSGSGSMGMVLQSIGGGGGLSGSSGSLGATKYAFSLGADGSSSGDGGTVTAALHLGSTTTTTGDGAIGVFAQSIGAGGGIVSPVGSAFAQTPGLRFGADGGSSGAGGAVNVQLGGSAITTTGIAAHGVFAQSIGGGGGYGGIGTLLGTTSALVGSFNGGASGNGGAISITNADTELGINTGGYLAHGVFAQSLGGGGGLVGTPFSSSTKVTDSLDQLTAALHTLVTSQGGTSSLADNMDNISAGLRGYAAVLDNGSTTLSEAVTRLASLKASRSSSSDTGGSIGIQLSGDITATGPDAYAILAQSGYQTLDGSLDTSVKGGNIQIKHSSGVLTGGAGNGAAIGIDGGNNNQVEILAGSTISSLSGVAIRSSFGRETVLNFGTIIGDLDLSTGGGSDDNTVTNYKSGTYVSSTQGSIRLAGPGRFGTFLNEGTFDVAGVGTLGSVQLYNASLVLGSYYGHGSVLVDVQTTSSGENIADLITTTSLHLGGVDFKPHAVDTLMPGDFTVVQANNISRAGIGMTVGVDYTGPITWSGSIRASSISISPSASFLSAAGTGLSATETSVANTMQNAWNDSNSDMSGLFATMANLTTQSSYRTALESMANTESIGQSAVVQTLAARTSMNTALSCPVFVGTGTMLQETECTWARVSGAQAWRSDGGRGEGFSQDGLSYRLGGQKEIADDWFLGFSAAYSSMWSKSNDSLSSTDGNSGDVSVALKHQIGPWLFAASLHGGYGRYDSQSLFMIGNNAWTATDDNDVWTAGLRLRASYEFAFEDWYLRPHADIDLIYTSMSSYDIAGPGLQLVADPMRDWNVVFEPGLEIGTRINLENDAWLRAYGRIGGTFISNAHTQTNVMLSDGIRPGVEFTSYSQMPDALLDLGAGLQFMSAEAYELRGEYRAQIADRYFGHELSLRASIRF